MGHEIEVCSDRADPFIGYPRDFRVLAAFFTAADRALRLRAAAALCA